jgi:hypothetical protein
MSTHFLFIAKIVSEKRQEVQLYVTRTGGKKYEFIPVKLPFPLLKQHSYTILDYTSRQVFIHVTHTVEGVSYGNIYKSDSSGSVFSLAVSNNVRNNYGYCDFSKIKGMHGVYLVNRYDSDDLSRARIQWENAQGPEDKERALEMNLKKKTKISFDKGGQWHQVEPTVANPKCGSDSTCSLHLNSLSSFGVGPITTVENAPGVILATGNEGEHLEEA